MWHELQRATGNPSVGTEGAWSLLLGALRLHVTPKCKCKIEKKMRRKKGAFPKFTLHWLSLRCHHLGDFFRNKFYCFCCCYLVAKSCPSLCYPMDCSPTGSSVHGILQVRILEWVAISFSRGSSRSEDWTHVSCIGRRILYHEPPGMPKFYSRKLDKKLIYNLDFPWVCYLTHTILAKDPKWGSLFTQELLDINLGHLTVSLSC